MRIFPSHDVVYTGCTNILDDVQLSHKSKYDLFLWIDCMYQLDGDAEMKVKGLHTGDDGIHEGYTHEGLV